ncbi:hypothetical protein AQUCO_02700160v1 [Aquilegia coerulea]|uniref:Elongator complex protein 6 n=1 Tax=Aquilegia coerulea TaxID=218851 RepID=A0A2G5D6D2_AQUCA|nr:hypothetical protein AQUCO_02700160v1 [Aquilegia coerulea]
MNNSSNLLDETLGFNRESFQGSLPHGRITLIEDCVETSGAFVLHHLLKRALFSHSSSGVVLFVALAHPFSHYDRILRKQGCNLATQRENGRFLFFDMLKLDCPDGIEGLVELFHKIQKTVKVCSSPEYNRSDITIMIDDISLMEVATHGSSNYVLDFLHYCHTLTSEIGCSLVLLSHDDVYLSTTAPSLMLQIEYLTDVVIKMEPLATGLATDVHGQLTVLNKEIVDEHGTLRNRIHNFHFKVKENSVEYFYPGSRN